MLVQTLRRGLKPGICHDSVGDRSCWRRTPGGGTARRVLVRYRPVRCRPSTQTRTPPHCPWEACSAPRRTVESQMGRPAGHSQQKPHDGHIPTRAWWELHMPTWQGREAQDSALQLPVEPCRAGSSWRHSWNPASRTPGYCPYAASINVQRVPEPPPCPWLAAAPVWESLRKTSAHELASFSIGRRNVRPMATGPIPPSLLVKGRRDAPKKIRRRASGIEYLIPLHL